MRFDYITRMTNTEILSAITCLERELATTGELCNKKRLKLHELKVEKSNRQHKTPRAHIVRG